MKIINTFAKMSAACGNFTMQMAQAHYADLAEMDRACSSMSMQEQHGHTERH